MNNGLQSLRTPTVDMRTTIRGNMHAMRAGRTLPAPAVPTIERERVTGIGPAFSAWEDGSGGLPANVGEQHAQVNRDARTAANKDGPRRPRDARGMEWSRFS